MERPNLKICIENDADSESDEEKPIIEDFEDDEEAEGSEEGEIASSKQSESGKSVDVGSDGDDNDEHDAETQATLEVSMDHKLLHEPKRYENKAGEFLTGFDLSLKEYVEMREKRAERFNIKDPPKTMSEDERKLLYDSLGINLEDIDSDERGIRLEAIHLHGVQNMSTQDVFQYFQGFAPGSLEWIDDISCNVVWLESVTAARAMFHMSNPRDEDEMKLSEEQRKSRTSIEEDKSATESMEVEHGSKSDSKIEKSDKDSTHSEEKPESATKPSNEDDNFDYELNLMSDDEEENKKGEDKTSDKNSSGTNVDDATGMKDDNETKDKAESESQQSEGTNNIETTDDMDVDGETKNKNLNMAKKEYDMPPGKWRIGLPYQNKAQILYFRYATRADKKLRGAEKRSDYYRKYGNPNFGGMKGLISGSKKRRILSSKYRKEEEEAKKMISKTKKFSLSGETTFDEHLKAEQDRLKKVGLELREDTSSNEEEFTDEEDEGQKRFNEFDDVEEELRNLLGESSPPPKKRTMRMHADDEEDEIKKKRSGSADYTESSIHSRVHSTHHRLGDARSRIKGRRPDKNSHLQSTGGDLRNRLGRKQIRDDHEAFGISYVPSLTIQVEPD